YFKKFNFSKKQVQKYLDSALKDIKIAEESKIAEVKFQFAYNSLIKLGIALVACRGYKVSSRMGHHTKILEKMSKILGDKNILMYGNEMRKTRNKELYDGGVIITNKQTEEYFDFILKVYKSSQKFFKGYFNTLL
ncbi:MAG TPA: hypothetical protein VMZ91_08955, partial [Candidatus Paceibacterota bacterium]|nr:hypothetical protein [Candidatus Paceibacterota bacterium]